ncbi:MAG TPA: hypothetical protein VFR44_14110, partial [Actinomycetota bacterium]|nr:hypothetical protein [Actinomycetota bacterium]
WSIDPLLELAKTHCYSRRRSESTLTALADGYGGLRDGWRDAIDLYVLYQWLELGDWSAAGGNTAPLAGITDEIRAARRRLTARELRESSR